MTASPIAHSPSGTEAAIGLFVFSWIAQFTAHAVAEKRSPALLDNLAGGKTLLIYPAFRTSSTQHPHNSPNPGPVLCSFRTSLCTWIQTSATEGGHQWRWR